MILIRTIKIVSLRRKSRLSRSDQGPEIGFLDSGCLELMDVYSHFESFEVHLLPLLYCGWNPGHLVGSFLSWEEFIALVVLLEPSRGGGGETCSCAADCTSLGSRKASLLYLMRCASAPLHLALRGPSFMRETACPDLIEGRNLRSDFAGCHHEASWRIAFEERP